MRGKIRIKKMDSGGSVTPLSSNMFSNPLFRFNGPSHEQGGIPINYKGTPVEVEGDETGFVDSKGDLTVFGNLYVPGTNKKFKTVSKDIADAEEKAAKRLKYAAKTMNQVKYFDDPLDQLTANTASVMGKSAIDQQKRATSAKEELASLQERMLGVANYMGVEPKAMWGKADNGKRIKKNPLYNMPEWEPNPPRNPNIPPIDWMANAPSWLQPEANVDVPRDRLGYDLDYLPSSTKYPVNTKDVARELTRPVSERKVEATGPNPGWYFPNNTSRVYNDRLGIGQILPELYTLATNKKEFVPNQSFTPTLNQSYQVSFQDRLNQNNSTFRAIAQSARNNPAAASQLAAQKYAADNQVLGEQFRTNQSIQDQITNRNIDLINQAQLTNLNLNREATIAREQNAAATRATTREALKSIANKSEQMRQYNRGLSLYSQLIPHYQYDSRTGTWGFDESGPAANINISGVPIQPYVPASPYGESRVTNYNRDPRGRVTTKREDRTPGIMKIFGR
jgi:hypothetical protein